MRINVAGLRPEHAISGLEVNVEAGAEGLRRDIAERIGAVPERLRLIHMGHLIDDSRPLSSFLQEGTTIHVVPITGPILPSGPSAGNSSSNNNYEQGGASAGNLPELAAVWRGIPDPLLGLIQHSLSGLVGQTTGRTPVMFQGGIVGGGMGSPPTENSQSPQPQQPQQRAQPQQPAEGRPQQQQQHRVSFSYAIPTPETFTPTPVHVHVHVTLEDLEQLPERLERFRSRMQPSGLNASLHVERGPLPNTNNSFAQPAETGTTAPNNDNYNTNNTNSTGNENGAANALPQAMGEVENASGEVPPGGDEEATQSEDLLHTFFSDLPPASVLQLIMGNFSVLAPLRQRVVEAISQFGVPPERAAQSAEWEDWRRHLDGELGPYIEDFESDPAVMEYVAREARPQGNFLPEFRRYLVFVWEEVVRATLNPVADSSEWVRELKVASARALGVAAERASIWFERGLEGLGGFFVLLLQFALSRATHSRAQAQAQPFLQMLSLMRGALSGFLSTWHAEYLSRHRRDTDSSIFEGAAAPVPERNSEADDLLDDCLDELCSGNNEGAGDERGAADRVYGNADGVRIALRAFGGMPSGEEEDYLPTRPALPPRAAARQRPQQLHNVEASKEVNANRCEAKKSRKEDRGEGRQLKRKKKRGKYGFCGFRRGELEKKKRWRTCAKGRPQRCCVLSLACAAVLFVIANVFRSQTRAPTPPPIARTGVRTQKAARGICLFTFVHPPLLLFAFAFVGQARDLRAAHFFFSCRCFSRSRAPTRSTGHARPHAPTAEPRANGARNPTFYAESYNFSFSNENATPPQGQLNNRYSERIWQGVALPTPGAAQAEPATKCTSQWLTKVKPRHLEPPPPPPKKKKKIRTPGRKGRAAE
ncbi:ubiquitin-like protein [Trypanosoma rangeli]|uniref:Ubiquitin-like protein n=1 Tax=Trypanosoma rangeli TaxID=5698 RepID=A0A422NGF5_TRYRA|nr:ubiquitin-like protein [Trypanosoma rangeli]RNF04538.1 ubiquitin-like protein [Trypanosoma rangeli]|eukprot:RNF04538.1 ubiquitin-like protein [Trypanosoma rangeli]